jgi:hypothetical protein
MRRLVTFTIVLDIDESTFGIEAPENEVRDFTDIVLPDVARRLGDEAGRLLEFHADGVQVDDNRAEMSRPFDETREPF